MPARLPAASLCRSLVASLPIVLLFCSPAAADTQLGVRVPEGFEATLYADDDLAHDVYSMTLDSQGRVVVSGAGYVRILIDTDGDGRADAFRQFADGPATGAQGMYFHGRDLLCTGDAGLIRYRDRNSDDRSDGPPDVFLKIQAGGEHDVHSVQQGPDGWWYLIAGNSAKVTSAYATLETSPIRNPEAGTILRLKADLSGGEIVADGFRNAYDFTFNAQGDLFTYDSDDERDISLPWYRPTRVFHVLPAGHAGWISRSWKRPAYFFDMQPVVGEFGRGSPTGLVCYRHTQFPEPYRGAVFVLDWTYGRVIALPVRRAGDTWSAEPISFMSGVGQHGFAPTDVEIAPDGSLYVSVGGRGTRGGVYRVRWKGAEPEPFPPAAGSPKKKLTACLRVPQPLSSWSRRFWMPVARSLGREPFIKAALDEQRTPAERVRAIEVLTELFGGPDADILLNLSAALPAEVRARAVWALGRTSAAAPPPELIAPYLQDDDPLVVRCALEALLGVDEEYGFEGLGLGLVRALGGGDRFNRQLAARVAVRMDDSGYIELLAAASSEPRAALICEAAGAWRVPTKIDPSALSAALTLLESDRPAAEKLDAARVMQIALGDMGPSERTPAAFDAYSSRLDLGRWERDLDPIRARLAAVFPAGNADLDHELGRLAAMLTPYNETLLDRALAPLTAESHPVGDIHWLAVAARIPVPRSARQRKSIAAAFVELEPKIVARKLVQDSSWDGRITEIYKEHVKLDPDLPGALLEQPKFGRPGHVVYLSELPGEHLGKAIAAFSRAAELDANYPWTNDVVFVFGESPKHRETVRRLFDRFNVRGAVLMVLSASPEEQDRPRFIEGLDSSQIEVLTACVDALTKLPAGGSAQEHSALVQLLRTLDRDPREYALREKVVELLQRNTGQQFGFKFGKEGHRPQPAVIARWTEWLRQEHPGSVQSASGGNVPNVEELLAGVPWDKGNVEAGAKLFAARSCAQCHGGRGAVGPDLKGVTGRFSREDLFTSIVDPNRDVSARYQTELIQTSDGKVYSGVIVYESVDGLLLRNGTNQTFRIEAGDIEERRKLKSSLMPAGLLKDLTPAELADLYAYVRSLGEQ